MLRSNRLIVVSLAGLFGACSLSVEGFEYRPGAGGSGGSGAGGVAGDMSGSSSSVSTGAEDCFDAIDTDGDGAIDCADTDCQVAAACASVPEGWTLVRVSDASPDEPAGKCPDSSTGTLYFKDPAGAPACSPCDCGPPQGASCNAPEMTCGYDNNDCSGGPGFEVVTDDNDCIDLSYGEAAPVNIPDGFHSPGSCKLTAPAELQNPGTCAATGGTQMPEPMWGSAVLVCPGAADVGGCEAGKVCLPLGGSVCITREGEDACPAEWPVATTVFTGGEDARSCSACACKVGCAGGKYVIRDTPDCGDYDPPVTVDSVNCVMTPKLFDYDDTSLSPTVATPVVASCDGGEALGQVNPAGAQRICCQQ